ncbi:MAG: urocanate hydratase [Alphaproteobacteria bacterium]
MAATRTLRRPNVNIKATTGTQLRCKSWRAESILRMLENNLENGENPDELVIYAGRAKAARDWESYDQIVAALKILEEDQTLVMQSGKPLGVFRTQKSMPMVIMASGGVVGATNRDPIHQELEEKGLTIMPGMTAAAWQYIGSQGILQGTYETFMAAARENFGGTLEGRMVLTAGCGGMGGAQPLAGKLAGAATLVLDVDEDRIQRRIDSGYCDVMTHDLDEALKWIDEAKKARKGKSVGLVANVGDIYPILLDRNIIPEIVTDQTTVRPGRGYVPQGMTSDEAYAMFDTDREQVVRRGHATIKIHAQCMMEFEKRGSIVFEYGNGLRLEAEAAGYPEARKMRGFIERYVRTLFEEGKGPSRWLAISGDPHDIEVVDDIIEANWSDNSSIVQWIRQAREHVHFTGLPARIGWLGYGERAKLAKLVNQAVKEGKTKGPIAFTRDHLDSGSTAIPFRENEKMMDGSDRIADWPILNGLINACSGADVIAIHGIGSAGQTTVADGSDDAGERLERVMTTDTGIGVLRHAEAGYETSKKLANESGLAASVAGRKY